MSPSDVQTERTSVTNVFDHFNATMGKWRSIFLRPVRWEIEAERSLLGDPQSHIDEELLKRADFGIAIFRERFGTLRDDGDSHSTHEVRLMRQLGKPILFFHMTRPNPRASARDEERTQQLSLLGPFLKEVESWGLMNACSSAADFERQLSIQLFNNYGIITGDSTFSAERSEPTVRSEDELDAGTEWTPKRDKNKLKISAKVYARAEKKLIEPEIERIRKVARKVKVLDIGCGYGYDAEQKFGEYEFVEVLGVDRSVDAIADANARAARPANISFRVFEAATEKLPTAHFVHLAGVLGHMPHKGESLQACWESVLDEGCLYVREHEDQFSLTFPESENTRELVDLTQKVRGAPDREMGRKLFGLIRNLTPKPKSIEFHLVPFFYYEGSDLEVNDAFEMAHGLRLSYARQNAGKNRSNESAALVHKMMAQNFADERDFFLETDELFFMEAKVVAIVRK